MVIDCSSKVSGMRNHITVRRIKFLQRILTKPSTLQLTIFRCSSVDKADEFTVKLGDASKIVKPPKHPEYVPQKYLLPDLSQEVLEHLHWMLQKDILGQDIFLLGRPGPLRRHIAMQYLEMTGRELEFVSLSRDTTEADLKQRREIKSGTATYFDQSAVRAAVEGRVLVLEGIEKAERNVLPVLNNLLENREMQLEDGRFLMPASRYDKMLKEHSQEELDRWKLVRVSEDFRVIALGIPVPKYTGNPLDPPLRSRFQARDIGNLSFKAQLEILRAKAPNADQVQVSQLLSCCYALLSQESSSLGLPDFPAETLPDIVTILEKFPNKSLQSLFNRLYPYRSFLGKEGQQAVDDILKTFNISEQGNTRKTQYNKNQQSKSSNFVYTPYQSELIEEMRQSLLSHDICLIGPRGCGKSVTIRELASILGYQIEPIVLYQDMTSRDLIQQRTTLPNGDTVWEYAPLVTAALEGKMAVLDGIHRIHPSTLSIVHRLVHDRELQLHDGQRLLRHDRYDELLSKHNLTKENLAKAGVHRIDPKFCIVALAEPPSRTSNVHWLSSELLSLFVFHEMRPLCQEEEIKIIEKRYGHVNPSLPEVMNLAHHLRSSGDATLRSLAGSLSTRQLLRIARRLAAYPSTDIVDIIQRSCLSRFLPSLAREALDNTMARMGFSIDSIPQNISGNICEINGDEVKIGNTIAKRYQTVAESKVPDIQFFNVPQHISLLEYLLQDFILGDHLLIVGNQGVGKNKLADRLLQLLHRPREYIQLHRDTTVQTLTLQPTVKDGIVVYEDSPLVQAVKLGHVLVVDEADKAPTHVTCILKTLVESGEMILSDGRRIVPRNDPRAVSGLKDIIPIHPEFRMIVLANRPGFPFLGNDFFGSLGDLFSCHAIDNPSPESELSLLKQYGPDVPDRIIERLVKAFSELRDMADRGLVQYPYSTREVVNIVKHLQAFPDEALAIAVRNVFDFDQYSQEVQETLVRTLHKYGIPIGANPVNVHLAKEFPLPKPQLLGHWTVEHSQDITESSILEITNRQLKRKRPTTLHQYQHVLDRVEARAAVFSELQSYWSIPMGETESVSGLAVQKSLENDMLQDDVYILKCNPLSLLHMVPSSDYIKELHLHGFASFDWTRRSQYTLAARNDGIVLVHEATSGSLLFVDVNKGEAFNAQLQTLVESSKDMFSKKVHGANNGHWCLLPELLNTSGTVVLYEHGGHKVQVVNTENLMSTSMTLPFTISQICLSSTDKWLVQDTQNGKYMLCKQNPDDPCPSLLHPIKDTCDNKLGSITGCSIDSLSTDALSQSLGQKIEAPNRVLTSGMSHGAIVVGFPELDLSSNEVYVFPRQEASKQQEKMIFLNDCGQIVRPVPVSKAPREARVSERRQTDNDIGSFLEVTDLANHKLRYVPVPKPRTIHPAAFSLHPLFIAAGSNGGLITVDVTGCVRLWETGLLNLEKSLLEWRKMIGSEKKYLQMTKERYSGADVSSPKHGKVDEKNAPHVGGNTWAGGTGGRDTAGLGGKGGPYRLDAGHTVHQVTQVEKDAVPEHVRKAAHEMAQRAFKQRLREIHMSEYDAGLYEQLSNAVSQQVKSLRVILSSLQAKSKERQWVKHQTTGELDDAKLIEGLTGEHTIYRRRAEKEPELGAPQLKPKRLRLVVDVSGSMYRFNSYDGRLDREMEAVIMVFEAFQGHENRILYDIVGHSGESSYVPFVTKDSAPSNNKQRLDIIKTMHAHSQFCLSGDNTLEATVEAITSLSKEDCDEGIVVILSDANLERYGIPPAAFAKALSADPKINAYAIFIGSLGDQAIRLTNNLPAGRAFVCLDLKLIPQILQQIFAASVLNTT